MKCAYERQRATATLNVYMRESERCNSCNIKCAYDRWRESATLNVHMKDRQTATAIPNCDK
jgi:hypothetical protein